MYSRITRFTSTRCAASSQRPRGQARENDGHGRVHRAHLAHEALEGDEDLLGALPAVVDIVPAHMHHDEPRPIRRDEPIGVANEIGDPEGIDAAIDDGVPGQILVDGLPAEELRIPDEENRPRGWRIGLVLGLVSRDLRLEAVGIARLRERRRP
jgi:hypothetical protein